MFITFKLLLIKQIFEKNKSLKAASESRTQFWPKIIPEIIVLRSFSIRAILIVSMEQKLMKELPICFYVAGKIPCFYEFIIGTSFYNK